MKLRMGCVLVGFLLFVLSIAAQTASSGSTPLPVPSLVNFDGVLDLPPAAIRSLARLASPSIYIKTSKEERRSGWKPKTCKLTRPDTTRLRSARPPARECLPACLLPAKPDGWACRFRDRRSSRASC